MKEFEVLGDLLVRIIDKKATVQIEVGKTGTPPEIGFWTPSDRVLDLDDSEDIIRLKDRNKLFPVGHQWEILKWGFVLDDKMKAPLLVDCCSSEVGDKTQVKIKYELGANRELNDVDITIPIDSGIYPEVSQYDGEFHYNAQRNSLSWILKLIDTNNRQSSLQFTTAKVKGENFFPLQISSSKYTYAQINIFHVTSTTSDVNVEFS